MPVVEVKQLVKEYRKVTRRPGVLGSVRDLFAPQVGTTRAVDGIDLTIEAGEFIGYIGPNGAGKSTTIKMMTGILKATSGSLAVLGLDPFRDRRTLTRRIGAVFGQRSQLWWDIAVRESFWLLKRIYDVPDAEFDKRFSHLQEVLGLAELLSTPVRKLSLGQRMRCDIAASLLHGPEILFLDEPTIGLDTVVKDEIRRFLRRVNEELKTTVLLTTHDLHEIEELTRRIVVIDHGKIIYDGDLQRIRTLPGIKRSVTVDFSREVSGAELVAKFSGRADVTQPSARRVTVEFDQRRVGSVDIIRELFQFGDVADLTVSEADIEEVIRKIYRDGGQVFNAASGA